MGNSMKPSNEYFAGLFDGEGFVRIDNHFHQKVTGNIRYNLHCGIAMTHMPAVKLCFDLWGGMYKGDKSFQERYARNRIIYRWSIVGNKAYRFLCDIQKFSIVKREQIDIGIAFQEHIQKHKSKMIGRWKDPIGLAKQDAYKAAIFAERAIMCDQIRLLKKQEFPLIASDA
jgi:hypothetical protein